MLQSLLCQAVPKRRLTCVEAFGTETQALKRISSKTNTVREQRDLRSLAIRASFRVRAVVQLFVLVLAAGRARKGRPI